MKTLLIVLAAAWSLIVAARPASSDELFSGGQSWATRFGELRYEASAIAIGRGDPVAGGVHAEAQRLAILAADFEYSADVTLRAGAEAHLQFRISDDGRYGVLLSPQRFAIYRFQRLPYLAMTPPRECAPRQPGAFTHCPQWSEGAAAQQTTSNPASNWTPLDAPVFELLRQCPWPGGKPLRSGTTHHLSISARGASIHVALDGSSCRAIVPNPAIAVGRFGIYVHGTEADVRHVTFRNLRATSDPGARDNFALLYSTLGYEARGTKRALIRTLNDVPETLVDPRRSTFTVIHANGRVAKAGVLRRLPGKTFGMQLWDADFSDVSADGFYTIEASVGVPSGRHHLRSAAFEIRSRLITQRVLEPMSIVNAEVRRSADEDFWRNWIRESGAWHVGVDGAFVADHADAGAGATITRVFNTDNVPLDRIAARDFRLVGRVTIVSGCDAQLRFEDVDRTWWAVTLQAGTAAGCAFGPRAGAVRLSREGPGVEKGFATVRTEPFPNHRPFQTGHPYNLEILVKGRDLSVFVDQPHGSTSNASLRFDKLPARSGRFGLKAWASTVRFEDVQAWIETVKFQRLPPERTRIPTFLNNDHGDVRQVPCQYTPLKCPDGNCRNPVRLQDGTTEEVNACNPLFGQLHGFHDANSNVAEATSHGAFLSGLMQTWTRRASTFTQAERESLRRAIVTNVLYLETLQHESGTAGQFAHSEMGRVNVGGSGAYSTIYALYGLSEFAADGQWIDAALADRACKASIAATTWLWPGEPEPILASIVYTRLARCVERRGDRGAAYWKAALSAAGKVLDLFARPEGFRDQDRTWSRIVPWFEGVYELTRYQPKISAHYRDRLMPIAAALVTHLLDEHRCDSTNPQASDLCQANGFEVLPQASGEATKAHTWHRMALVPLSQQGFKGAWWYNVNGHFPTAAVDAILLAAMTGNQRLGRLAAGNLYWGLGLNPGIPAAKIARAVPDGTVWQAAAFIRGIDAPFARGAEAFRLESYSAKGWLDWWEQRFDAPRREAWRIDPQARFTVPPSRSFLTFVNGHVIWDGQWDYRNSGEDGWQSGETFIMSDAAFLKAALLFEDWLEQVDVSGGNPYRTDRVGFFDTSHIDRVGTGWTFDDPDRAAAAHASRAAHEFCRAKGFGGGRFTGHVVGERVGTLCMPTTAAFFDVQTAQGEESWDINALAWAKVARMATEFCEARSFAAGFFTGHQLNRRHGVVCLQPDTTVAAFDATSAEIAASGFPFDAVEAVPWASAARAATNVCVARGFAGGFLTGRQTSRGVGLVCLVS